MAVTAGSIWHIVPVASYASASDNNGGGFNPAAAGTNYAYGANMPASGAPILALTDLACASNTTVTSATGGFTAAMVGNMLRIVSGTNALAGWYEIKTRVDTNTITIDRTCATGGNMSSGVGNVGGALATPGALSTCWASTTVAASGQTAYIKGGTYTLSTTTAGSGGPVSIPAGFLCGIEGYNTTFADRGAFAILDAGAQTSVGALVVLANTASTTRQYVASIKIDGKSGSGNNGFSLTDPENRAYKCWAVNCDQATTNYGFYGGMPVYCYALDCGVGFSSIYGAYGCVAKSCSADGFNIAPVGNLIATACIADDNAGDGFKATAVSAMFFNCSAYSNGGDGFDLDDAADMWCVNCVATENGAFGYATLATVTLINCAAYNNTSGRASGTTNAPMDISPVTCTGSPFVDAAGADFRPDATAAEGVYLRAAGLGAYGQTNAVDIGAVQHADPAPAGTTNLIIHAG